MYTSTFTASNRTYTDTSPAGRQQLVTLDTKERIATTQVSGLLPTQLAYDSRGAQPQPRKVPANSVSPTTRMAVWPSMTDPLKPKRSFSYDADGLLLTTTLPDGLTINHICDANGNLTAITPPGKSVHDFSYNSINLPSS